MKVSYFAASRRLATFAILLAFVVLGGYSLQELPIDFLPNITYPLIKVHMSWQGATPDEIDREIADKVERQVAMVDDLDYLESSILEGSYTLFVNYKYGVDVNVAYQDTLAAMERAMKELPKDMEPPFIIKADPQQLPVVQLTISSDEWDLVKLRTWVDEWLQDQLLAIPGVAGSEIVGGFKREIRIHLDRDALEKYELGLNDVLKRLRDENIDQFSGRVTIGPKEIIARTSGEYRSLQEIRNVLLTRHGQAKVYIKDVAEVIDSHEEPRVITRLDGKACVKLSVHKQASANTVEVAQAVDKQIANLLPRIPASIEIGTVENQADYVQAALSGVWNTAIQTAIVVVLIIWLFLGSWRQVLVVALALPLTLILNFGLMRLGGFSLNIFSLGGLVIAIGVLVDNSVIVVETLTRKRSEMPEATLLEIVVAATSEIGPALFAGTLSFLALFVPFLFVPGFITLLFHELILVIAGIILVSLAMALTVTPMLSTFILKKPSAETKKTSFEYFFERITNLYVVLVSECLRMRWTVVTVFGLLLIGAVLHSTKLGTEFLPQMDDGRVMIKIKLPTGASLAETDETISRIEKAVSDDPYIASLFSLAGGKVVGLYTYEIANEGEINIQLVPKKERTFSTQEYIARIRPLVGKILVPGGKAMVMPMKIKGLRQIGESSIELKIQGQNIETLYDLARKTATAMNTHEYFTNVHLSLDMTKPEYQVVIDRTRAAELGISVNSVAETMRSMITGAVATRYRENNEYYNIRVMIPENKFETRQDIENLPIQNDKGGFVRIKDLAEVRQAVGPVEIVRENQSKQVIVRSDATGVSMGEAVNELKTILADLDFPPGYVTRLGGNAAMMADMQKQLLIIMCFAIFFSFIILTVQFDDLKLPALILFSVPFCSIGLVWIMAWCNALVGATVIIGVLVIIAATVSDGVLLLEFANRITADEKCTPSEAVLKAAKLRLRPRVMTTVSTLVGFIPLALAMEEGADMLQPMAIAAIGGLLMEMPVALFLMPCLYVISSRESS